MTTPAAPPWSVAVPPGPRPNSEGLLQSGINRYGTYVVSGAAPKWTVSPGKPPPPYLTEVDWKITRAGLLGKVSNLEAAIGQWPNADLDPPTSAAMLTSLRAMPKPATMLDLAQALRFADHAIGLASSTDIAQTASQVGQKLLEWYPAGQMLAWAKSYEFVMSARPAHLLAGISLAGWDGVEEALKSRRGGLWFAGEDIATTKPAPLYLGLANPNDLPGAVFEAVPATFIFEFGEYLKNDPSLDFVSMRYIHGVSSTTYMSPALPTTVGIVQMGSLEQDAMRSWFVQGFNRLAQHVTRWENYMTKAGELRPVVLQEVNMTVSRILNVTAHLLASGDRDSRFADFWQLVDLYAGFGIGGIPRLFGEKFLEDVVNQACRTMPGAVGRLFEEFARNLYQEWLDATVSGVVPPSLVTVSGIQVPYPKGSRLLTRTAFFATHVQERRDTTHGYDLDDDTQAALLGIHDGSLPERLPEWGRLMLVALVADPSVFIERRFL